MEYIYIAEDEENIQEMLRHSLESQGYRVSCFSSGDTLLMAAEEYPPHLILLDIMMPIMDGMQALERLKENPRTRDVPVLLLSAKTAECQKVAGLDLGADDYITKPFGVMELLARVRAALRRSAARNGGEIQAADLSMNTLNREVRQSGKLLELTLKEYELLRRLMENCPRPLSREELLRGVWGYDYPGETRTVDMHIKTLRFKLGDDADNPQYIRTIRAVGYQFIPSEESGLHL